MAGCKRNAGLHGKRLSVLLCALLLSALLFVGCTSEKNKPTPSQPHKGTLSASPTPTEGLLPTKLQRNGQGDVVLRVYMEEEETIRVLPLEEYLCGVVAGEMDPSWPQEALKAQSILARTFALEFLTDQKSRYAGADISTDTTEAQAYDASRVTDAVREAVRSTRGQVLTYEGELIHAWFHAHSGGMTELAKPGLEWEGDELPYLQVKEVEEDPSAPENVQHWSASFSRAEVLATLKEMGFSFSELDSMEIGKKGGSGRAVTLLVNGESVPAASFRLRLAPEKMKSTLLTELHLDKNGLTLAGEGYGHGVGLSQWGASVLAKQGKTANEILHTFFHGVQVQTVYP